MNDPGRPPRPVRSLNLLESLVKEEEAKAQSRGSVEVVIPTESRDSVTPEFYDVDKQQLTKEYSASTTFTEFKMKEINNISKGQKGNPQAGFKGKKLKKPRSRSNSADRPKSKKVTRPFSADYSQNKRSILSASEKRNSRPKTTKGRRINNRTSSPKGRRPRSPHSYSSDTYSSDDEYIKKEKFRSDSNSSQERRKKDDSDDFYDSDKQGDKKQRRNSGSSTSSFESGEKPNYNGKDNNRRNKKDRDSSSSSSSDSYSSDEERNKDSHKQMNGNVIYGDLKHRVDRKVTKRVYSDKHGKQRTRSDSENSSQQRMVVVDDYSPTVSSSEDESKKSETINRNNSKPPLLRPTKKRKPLLSRKKREGYKIFQINPDMYLEGKLQQKYTELEELMACSFVDQKSHMTRHHLYQMELIRDQYQNASHGLRSAGAIIPRSLPGEIRNRSTRPTSARLPSRRAESDQDSVNYDQAYGTLRSVMSAERLRKSDRIRTDIHADIPSSAKHNKKKKKKIQATYKAGKSDSEEETSERPSFSSKADSSSPRTPRSGPSIDDHIKYSKNERLKKWLKEKDKIYRQHVKEERKKKRDEREKLVNEANDKFERRIQSQKRVKKWMKEKNKEWVQIQKEKRRQEKEEDDWLDNYRKTKSVPGDSLQIRPQSAPTNRSEDYERENLRGAETPTNVKEEIRRKKEEEEENKQSKLAQEGPHPPQTKFIYKRPVAGKIKLKMEIRGKSPVGKKPDTVKNNGKDESDKDQATHMRLSYDEWVKKKRGDDVVRKKNAEKQRELAKSDPELERIIPALGKKRIEDKLNMRKRIDTGIRKFDDKTNRSFGGADFDGEAVEDRERPRSAYRLESDRNEFGEPALSVKQIQRPSTAPSNRKKVLLPQKSAKSPRKAIIPQRVDKVMANEDTDNPFQIPFSPEKGIPPHVAERQKRLFADQITSNLDEIEQRALLNAELIKEGVSEADIEALVDRKHETNGHNTVEVETEEDQHPKITELMYSPHRKEESSESSCDESDKAETGSKQAGGENETVVESSSKETEAIMKQENSNTEVIENDIVDRQEEQQHTENVEEDKNNDNGHSHYKTYDNLNELTLDSEAKTSANEDHLKEEVEILKKRVENLHLHSDPSVHSERTFNAGEDQGSSTAGVTDSAKITVVSETNTESNIVGILKESKREEEIPVPESSEEPVQKRSSNDPQVNGNEPGSPEEDLGNSRKRVSFNEQTEVFQSYESSSTDTVTPEPEEFDTQAEGLDAQPDYEIDNDDDMEDDRPDILKLQGQKMSFNIGGFELNPTVIKAEDENETENNDDSDKIFITNPDDEQGGSD